jgi:hypothetical protein
MNSAIRFGVYPERSRRTSRNCALGIYACAVLRSRSLYICRGISTNRPIFLQNKPNFPEVKMSLSSVSAKDYEDKSNPTLGENKPNSNPIQSQTNPIPSEAKMSATVSFTRTCDNNPAPPLRQNKPNSNPNKPNSLKAEMKATICPTGNYQNQLPRGSESNQTQCRNSPNCEPLSKIAEVGGVIYSFVGTKSSPFLLIVIDLPWPYWYSIAAKVRKLNHGTIVANEA